VIHDDLAEASGEPDEGELLPPVAPLVVPRRLGHRARELGGACVAAHRAARRAVGDAELRAALGLDARVPSATVWRDDRYMEWLREEGV